MRPGWSVRFDGGSFVVALSNGDMEIVVTTPIDLSQGFERMDFELYSFGVLDQKESATRPLYLKDKSLSGDVPRIGLMIPATALGSVEHGLAEERYFRDYAYVAIRLALEQLVRDAPEVFERLSSGPSPVPFSELFHENVAFLVLSCSKIPSSVNFSIDRLMPSLLSNGYVPTSACKPAEVRWVGPESLIEDTPGKEVAPRPRLKLSLISSDLENPAMLSRLLVMAATSGTSLLTQFFYLYQIFEYLMETVMRHRLPIIAGDMIRDLQSGTSSARDQFEALSDEMKEKGKLKLLVTKYSACDSELAEFSSVASEFLISIGLEPKSGIDAVYKVRNFLFHQARDLPDHEDKKLEEVVMAFSGYLPALLNSYRVPPSV